MLDVTYGRGLWWRSFQPEAFERHDLALDGVDFRTLPHEDRSWDSVCFDPPYVPRYGPNVARSRIDAAFRERYGLDVSRSEVELDALIRAGVAECARVARRWLLVKANDYCNGRQLRLGHLRVIDEATKHRLRLHDLIVHAGGVGPGGGQIKTIVRTRRAHSYLLVFRAMKARARSG